MNVDLIDHMGSDLTVVNAARVSFHKQSRWDNEEDWLDHDADLRLKDEDVKLIKYLATHRHWTPFAHPQITLRVKAPVFIRTQCFKHKQGFVENEVSRRYVDDDPAFYIPVLRKRNPNAKQGSLNEFPDNLELCDAAVFYAYDRCMEVYKILIGNGVAPEQARMVLPQGMYTEWYWTGSLAAFARFYKQRSDPHAQKEIQDLAEMISNVIQPLFPVSWEALSGK